VNLVEWVISIMYCYWVSLN